MDFAPRELLEKGTRTQVGLMSWGWAADREALRGQNTALFKLAVAVGGRAKGVPQECHSIRIASCKQKGHS